MSLDTRPSSVACCRARRCNECGLYKVAVNVLSRRTNHFFLRTSSIRAWSVPGRSRARSLSRTAASASPVAVRVRVLAKLVVGDGEAARIADRLDVPGDPGGALARGVPTQCANNVWTGRRGGSFSRFSPSSSGTGATSHASRTPSQATSRTRPACRDPRRGSLAWARGRERLCATLPTAIAAVYGPAVRVSLVLSTGPRARFSAT